MLKRILYLFLMSATLLVAGCATPCKMAFQKDATILKESPKPIYLLTATFKNDFKTGYQPELYVVNVEKKDAKEKKDRFNFTMDNAAKVNADKGGNGNTYLLRLELEPGEYVLRGFTGGSGVFPVHGTFFAPLHAELAANGPGIYYLGHVNATVRERKGNEFKAGPPIPLIDQAVTGFSGGTFDVDISDQFEPDCVVFKERFPVLNTVTIQKTLLPAFDREQAQKFWEQH